MRTQKAFYRVALLVAFFLAAILTPLTFAQDWQNPRDRSPRPQRPDTTPNTGATVEEEAEEEDDGPPPLAEEEGGRGKVPDYYYSPAVLTSEHVQNGEYRFRFSPPGEEDDIITGEQEQQEKEDAEFVQPLYRTMSLYYRHGSVDYMPESEPRVATSYHVEGENDEPCQIFISRWAFWPGLAPNAWGPATGPAQSLQDGPDSTAALMAVDPEMDMDYTIAAEQAFRLYRLTVLVGDPTKASMSFCELYREPGVPDDYWAFMERAEDAQAAAYEDNEITGLSPQWVLINSKMPPPLFLSDDAYGMDVPDDAIGVEGLGPRATHSTVRCFPEEEGMLQLPLTYSSMPMDYGYGWGWLGPLPYISFVPSWDDEGQMVNSWAITFDSGRRVEMFTEDPDDETRFVSVRGASNMTLDYIPSLDKFIFQIDRGNSQAERLEFHGWGNCQDAAQPGGELLRHVDARGRETLVEHSMEVITLSQFLPNSEGTQGTHVSLLLMRENGQGHYTQALLRKAHNKSRSWSSWDQEHNRQLAIFAGWIRPGSEVMRLGNSLGDLEILLFRFDLESDFPATGQWRWNKQLAFDYTHRDPASPFGGMVFDDDVRQAAEEMAENYCVETFEAYNQARRHLSSDARNGHPPNELVRSQTYLPQHADFSDEPGWGRWWGWWGHGRGWGWWGWGSWGYTGWGGWWGPYGHGLYGPYGHNQGEHCEDPASSHDPDNMCGYCHHHCHWHHHHWYWQRHDRSDRADPLYDPAYAHGYNTWRYKLVFNTWAGRTTLYQNHQGQVILRIDERGHMDYDPDSELPKECLVCDHVFEIQYRAVKYFRYDEETAPGKIAMHAANAAIDLPLLPLTPREYYTEQESRNAQAWATESLPAVDYDALEANLDLMNFRGGRSPYLRNHTGRIEQWEYSAQASQGQLSRRWIQAGDQGDELTTLSYTYVPNLILDAGSQDDAEEVSQLVVWLVATEKRHFAEDGYGLTSHTYDWHLAGEANPLGSILAYHGTERYVEENGQGPPLTSASAFDLTGREVWQQDEVGLLHYTAYDSEGRVTMRVEDVDLGLLIETIPEEFDDAISLDYTPSSIRINRRWLPEAWKTPNVGGLHKRTDIRYDQAGRRVETLGPWHPVEMQADYNTTELRMVRTATWEVFREGDIARLDEHYTAQGYYCPQGVELADPSRTVAMVGTITATQLDDGGRPLQRVQFSPFKDEGGHTLYADLGKHGMLDAEDHIDGELLFGENSSHAGKLTWKRWTYGGSLLRSEIDYIAIPDAGDGLGEEWVHYLETSYDHWYYSCWYNFFPERYRLRSTTTPAVSSYYDASRASPARTDQQGTRHQVTYFALNGKGFRKESSWQRHEEEVPNVADLSERTLPSTGNYVYEITWYDEDDRVVARSSRQAGDLTAQTQYTYDRLGRLKETRHYFFDVLSTSPYLLDMTVTPDGSDDEHELDDQEDEKIIEARFRAFQRFDGGSPSSGFEELDQFYRELILARDWQGRVLRSRDRTGTITATVYDALDRPISQYAGSCDGTQVLEDLYSPEDPDGDDGQQAPDHALAEAERRRLRTDPSLGKEAEVPRSDDRWQINNLQLTDRWFYETQDGQPTPYLSQHDTVRAFTPEAETFTGDRTLEYTTTRYEPYAGTVALAPFPEYDSMLDISDPQIVHWYRVSRTIEPDGGLYALTFDDELGTVYRHVMQSDGTGSQGRFLLGEYTLLGPGDRLLAQRRCKSPRVVYDPEIRHYEDGYFPIWQETRFEYDVLGRRTVMIEPAGAETRYAYDLAGNVVRQWLVSIEYIDTAQGPMPKEHVIEEIAYRRSYTGDVIVETTWRRNDNAPDTAQGLLSQTPDISQRSIVHTYYDQAGRVFLIENLGVVNDFARGYALPGPATHAGLNLYKIVPAGCPDENLEPYVPDGTRQLTWMFYGKISAEEPEITVHNDGRITYREFDTFGRKTAQVDNYVGPVGIQHWYESGGIPKTSTRDTGPHHADRLQFWHHTPYGQILRHEIADLDADGNAEDSAVTRYVYAYELDRRETVDEPIFRGSSLMAIIYPASDDALHGQLRVLGDGYDLERDRVDFTHHATGDIATRRDQRNVVLQFGYDDMGRHTETLVIDTEDDPLPDAIDRDIRGLRITLDGFGRLDRASSLSQSESGDWAVANEVERRYNQWGALLGDAQEHSQATVLGSPMFRYVYYERPRALVGEQLDATDQVHGRALRVVGLTYPSGREVGYDYDDPESFADRLGRIASIADLGPDAEPDPAHTVYRYVGRSTIIARQHPTGILPGGMELSFGQPEGATDYYDGIDPFGRAVEMHWRALGTDAFTYDRFAYGYLTTGAISHRVNLTMGATSFSETYAYDKLGMLAQVMRGSWNPTNQSIVTTEGSASWAWSLDQVGNWSANTFSPMGGNVQTVNQRRLHRLDSTIADPEYFGGPAIQGTPAWLSPVYDPAGNMVSVPTPGQESMAIDLQYDAWNRITAAFYDSNDNGRYDRSTDMLLVAYTYDALGRRIAKRTEVAQQFYYYDTASRLVEVRRDNTPDGWVQQQYVWDLMFPDVPIFRDADFTESYATYDRHFFTHDGRGSITAIIDRDTGIVDERYVYDPYGWRNVLDGSYNSLVGTRYENPLGYRGYWLDVETGLYEAGGRALHPTLGTWMTPDLSDNGNPMNRYWFDAAP